MSCLWRRAWNHQWSAAPAPGAGAGHCCFVTWFFLSIQSPVPPKYVFSDPYAFVPSAPLFCLFSCSSSPVFPLVVQHLKAHQMSLPKALWLHRHTLRGSICQKEQLFSPKLNNPSPSHVRFGVNPFLAQMVICRICWGFAMTCLWGRVLVFWSLFWVASKRWKHGSAEVNPPILVGQDIAHRPPGMFLALMRSIAVGDVWIQLDPGMEDWETKQEELHLQLDEKVHFFTLSLPRLMATEGFCDRRQSPWVNSGHSCKTTCCTL